MQKIQLSVIVPLYKQEKMVGKYLTALDKVLKSLKTTYEIICVVDGFVDKTFENAKKLNITNLIVIGYEKNQGKGNAVKFGMAKARGEIVGFVDGGFDLNYSAIPLALEHMKWYNADIIVGSKRHAASKVHYPWQRKILSWGYQMGVRLLFGINIRDSQVGMKFFKKEVAKAVFPKLMVKTFAFDIEILAVAHSFGYTRIYETPINLEMQFDNSTIVSFGFIKTVFSMLWDTLAVFYRLKILHYYNNK